MKFALTVLLLHMFVSASLASEVTDIPLARQVILKTKDSTWVPTPAQTRESLTAILAYLKKSANENQVDPTLAVGSKTLQAWIASQVRLILSNKVSYRVQFWGTTEEGRPVVYCNFFPAEEKSSDDGFRYWRKDKVAVEDGGYSFWFATYDPKTKQVIMFHSNGYAETRPVRSVSPPFLAADR